MIIKPRSLSGLADYTEAENIALSKWIRIVENEYRLFGFSRLIPRPLELQEVLLSKGGIQNLIFGVSRLHTGKLTDMALPFDRTVPLANWIARREGEVAFPYKRYDISYSFRGERAQAGRFQGFFQADVDIIGKGKLDLSADAEVINVVYLALKKLGFTDLYLCINDIKLTNCILQELSVPLEKHKEVLTVIDDLLKITKEQLLENLIKVHSFTDQEIQTIWNIFSYKGVVNGIVDILNKNGMMTENIKPIIDNLMNTIELLTTGGVEENNIIFCPAIVRGLDYYTGIVFETFLRGCENIGSIASGGRYENLASTFTKSILPGVGGSIGLTRLFSTAIKNNLVPIEQCTEADYFIGFRETTFRNQGMQIAFHLRKKGYNTDLYSGSDDFKKQLTYANKKGFNNAIFVMDSDSVFVKDMATGAQKDFKNIDDLLDYIQKKEM